jgi:hypothetical protein
LKHSATFEVTVGIPPKLGDTIKVATTKDTNMRKTTGNKIYHPGRWRKKDPCELLLPLRISLYHHYPPNHTKKADILLF